MDFSREALEYDRFKSLLSRYVRSPAARDRLAALSPSVDRTDLEARLALVGEAMAYLRDHSAGFGEVTGFDAALERLGPGGMTLELPEIEAVQEFATDVVGLRAAWGGGIRAFPLLARRVLSLPDLGPLRKLLSRAVHAGEIREEFSPELRRLRRDLETVRGRINQRLRAILRSSERAGQLQDSIVTVRNGRFVIPVRAEHQRSVAGIVHGSSSSGATVFMEPLETLDMNNDLVRIAENEEREVRRILGQLTDAIQEFREVLAQASEIRAGLEVLFGIARWGRDFDCTIPKFSDGYLCLRRARHPLLEDGLRARGGRVVPLDLETESDERVLVISGPNAGGKTVVLKTVGLFSLLAQSAVPVPASDAVLPIADRVLADIGDHQSIANQLSTFSAHVLTISEMVDRATGESLILLDEVGSSTEPAEGAALGIAVLEHFRAVGSRTVATTHYNRLKMYAETTPGVRNAAMEFDEETLEPTFALIAGLAGQSSGLRIAERLRLRKEILEVAWSRLDQSEIEAARFVDRLRHRIQELEAEKAELEARRQEFEIWKEDMKARIETERADWVEALERKFDALVADISRRAADSLRTSKGKDRKQFAEGLERARRAAVRQLEAEVISDRGIAGEEPGPRGPEAGLEPIAGARVRIRSLGAEGLILDVSGLVATVAIGQMKTKVDLAELEVLSVPAVALPANVRFESAPKEGGSSEINLLGCSREEALDRLDKFIDDAFLTGFPSVRIIHGTGKGILRTAVAEFLTAHPQVAGFEPAPQEQGGAGVTVATLVE